MIEGALERLDVHPDQPARYSLVVQRAANQPSSEFLPLNSLVNKGLRVEFNHRITCSECGGDTRRSYGEGYCYPCFKRLARCDLCVVSPTRCHYHQGTCREPEWGEAFCMQPHVVYLANSSGPKVGITTHGGQVRRWLDQGASQGLVVARTASRHLAGVLEDRLACRVSDRTDWRALLSAEAVPVDLPALRDTLRSTAEPLPDGVQWLNAEPVTELTYPVLAHPAALTRLGFGEAGVVEGRLLGIKGQYLMFEQGVFNVRRHRGFHVRVSVFDADVWARRRIATGRSLPQDQMELFQ